MSAAERRKRYEYIDRVRATKLKTIHISTVYSKSALIKPSSVVKSFVGVNEQKQAVFCRANSVVCSEDTETNVWLRSSRSILLFQIFLFPFASILSVCRNWTTINQCIFYLKNYFFRHILKRLSHKIVEIQISFEIWSKRVITFSLVWNFSLFSMNFKKTHLNELISINPLGFVIKTLKTEIISVKSE